MKASFSSRVFAYLIDIFLISIVAGLISMVIPQDKNLEKLYKEQDAIMENYVEGKINMQTYTNQIFDLNYDISKKTALLSIVQIFLSILYFCVFQFYQNGQTIGKRLLRIKVQKQNHSKLTMNDLVIRSSIINSILLNILTTALALLASKDIYIGGSLVLESIEYIFVMISVILIAFSKEKEGLHDKLLKTEVVRVENTVKEVEDAKCES